MEMIIASIIFLLTYLLIFTETIHKTLAALLGGFLLLFTGILGFSDILQLIDFQALVIILGLMIIVEVLRKSGIFQFLGIKVVKISKGDPKFLFLALMVLTVTLSAFLTNLTAIFIMCALTFMLCRSLKLNPIPFIISEAILANIAGITLLTGTPTNILVASASGISYMDFVRIILPLSLILIGVTILISLIFYRKEFKKISLEVGKLDEWSVVPDRKLFRNSLIIFFSMIIFFLVYDKIGLRLDFVVFAFTLISLLWSGADVDEILGKVDWGALFFFIGLFVVVGGLEKTGVLELIADKFVEWVNGNVVLSIPLILWTSTFVSGIVDNIPATLTFIPIVDILTNSFRMDVLWWCLIVGVAIGGNLTLISSPVNIIALSIARKEGYKISFKEYLKIALPTLMLHLVLSTLYFSFGYIIPLHGKL